MFDAKGNPIEIVQDPATGQEIIRRALPPADVAPVKKMLQEQAAIISNFSVLSQQIVGMQKQQFMMDEQLRQGDGKVAATIKALLLKHSLDPSIQWGYNTQLDCLEGRKAPAVPVPEAPKPLVAPPVK